MLYESSGEHPEIIPSLLKQYLIQQARNGKSGNSHQRITQLIQLLTPILRGGKNIYLKHIIIYRLHLDLTRIYKTGNRKIKVCGKHEIRETEFVLKTLPYCSNDPE